MRSASWWGTNIRAREDRLILEAYINLCKRPRGDSHFCGHVPPMFCNMLPFFFYLSPAQILDSLFFSFFDRSGCVYTPNVDGYPFFNVLNHRILLSHITHEFQTKLDVILKLLCSYNPSLRTFISV